MPAFPDLPIITPDPPRKTQAEKYGGLFYLGIAGLVVLLAMLSWFAVGLWSTRSIWADTYAVADGARPEAERVNAAWRLSRDPNVTDRQKWDLAVNPGLPELARYLLAESLGSGAVADGRSYALAVSRSRGWPGWLRILLARPLAYAAAEGSTLEGGPIEEMAGGDEPALSLWADATLSLSADLMRSKAATDRLVIAVSADRPVRTLARPLLDATRSIQPARNEHLDRATRWLRENDEGARKVWAGWTESAEGIRHQDGR